MLATVQHVQTPVRQLDHPTTVHQTAVSVVTAVTVVTVATVVTVVELCCVHQTVAALESTMTLELAAVQMLQSLPSSTSAFTFCHSVESQCVSQ